MTKTELINVINGMNRNKGAFYGFETLTKPRIRKTMANTNEPITFEVTIHKTFSAMVGISYENAVNNAKERNGEERDFEAQKPKGKHYVEGSDYLLQADKDENKYYIALDRIGATKTTYLIDGREATPEEVENLKENVFYKTKPHPYGITWRTYGVESILSVR